MEHLTFKQYIESKKKLREAIEHTPTTLVGYQVKKYCSIQIGENEQEKRTIALKPNQKILIEWRYDNIEEPTPTFIKFEGVSHIEETESFSTFWKTKKLQKWLSRHTKEEQNYGY